MAMPHCHIVKTFTNFAKNAAKCAKLRYWWLRAIGVIGNSGGPGRRTSLPIVNCREGPNNDGLAGPASVSTRRPMATC